MCAEPVLPIAANMKLSCRGGGEAWFFGWDRGQEGGSLLGLGREDKDSQLHFRDMVLRL